MAATNDRITVWLKLRDTARFARDAKVAEESIEKIGEAANDAETPLGRLKDSIGNFSDVLPLGTSRTRIFGFAVGTVLTFVVSMIPVVVGLGGSLVALAGSFGAAAAGAGLLATAFAGAMIPFGAFGVIVGDTINGFHKVATAFERWEIAVGAFGRNSQQAETALARLNAITEEFGGRHLLEAVKAWDEFTNLFRRSNLKTIGVVAQIFYDLIKAAQKMIPIFAEIAYEAARAVRGGLRDFVRMLSGTEIQYGLRILSEAFAEMAGPLIRAAGLFLLGFMRIATRLAPLMPPIAQGVERVAKSFADWGANGDLNQLVGQFRAWWGLLKAVGGLLYTILADGADEGKGLVNSLTGVINGWNEILKTDAGKNSLKDFFSDAASFTKTFITVIARVIAFIFKFGRALMPIYTTVFNALRTGWNDVMDAFAPMAPFWNNVLKPLLKGIVKGVLGGVVGAFKFLIFIVKIVATVLGAIGAKLGFLRGPLEFIGQVIGFVFGGAILKLLSLLGKLSPVLRPLGTLFRLLAVPINLAGKAVGFIFSKLGSLAVGIKSFAASVIPGFRSAWSKILGFLVGLGSRFYNVGKGLWGKLKDGIMKALGSGLGFAGDLAKGVANGVINLLNKAIPNKIPIPGMKDIDLPDSPIPMLATGGVVSGAGSWITGEAGPELNTLNNGRVTVQPLSGVQSLSPSSSVLKGQSRTIVVKTYLRGRQIAEAVAEEIDDEMARR